MKKNVGVLDRIIRIIFFIIFSYHVISDQVPGTFSIILGIVAIALTMTGLIGRCRRRYTVHMHDTEITILPVISVHPG